MQGHVYIKTFLFSSFISMIHETRIFSTHSINKFLCFIFISYTSLLFFFSSLFLHPLPRFFHLNNDTCVCRCMNIFCYVNRGIVISFVDTSDAHTHTHSGNVRRILICIFYYLVHVPTRIKIIFI